MKIEITAQQTAFFTQNGYIEFEGIDFSSEKIFDSTHQILASRFQTTKEKLSRIPAEELYRHGRDLWRSDELLKKFLTQKLFPLAAVLGAKRSLRLACDQWIPSDLTWSKRNSLNELFSIQGLVIGALVCATESKLPLRASLGLLPLPSHPGSVLFFKPHILLDLPQLIHSSPTDMYLIGYALPNALYIENSKDPATNDLKKLGYGFGDPLKNEFHPLISL